MATALSWKIISKLHYFLGASLFITQVGFANPEHEAHFFAEQLSQYQALLHTEEEFNKNIEQKISGFIPENQKNQISLKNIQGMYTDNMDRGLKDSDPIQQNLNKQRLQLPSNSTVHDTENLLQQRKRWHVHENDSIFSNHSLSKEINKMITCREGAKGEEKSCFKKRVVNFYTDNGATKTITISVAGSLTKAVLLSIDLKNGTVSVLNAQDFATLKFNPADDMYKAFNFIFWYYPSLVVPTNLSSKADEVLGEESDKQEITVQNTYFLKHPNSDALIRHIIFEEPSKSNDYVAKLGLVHWSYYWQNGAPFFGFDVSWKVTMPSSQQPIDSWEGCELLESNPRCTEIESQNLALNESRMIAGHPYPLSRSHWAEKKHYICGRGTSINTCKAIDSSQCEQIASTCALDKEGYCVEFEQTFRCGKKENSYNDGFEMGDPAEIFSVNDKENPLTYDTSEFADALTQFNAIKAMNAPMQDNLGGITGDPENPSVFHGQPRHCKVSLGSSLKDCCHLKGIAQGLLGGCSEEEKQLAVAQVKDKRCHKVAKKYCTHKALGSCVEKKEAYCCYGSQLAKILQEIAHEQLGIPWGEGENPNCGSLTAAQLSKLDFDAPFARAKLSQLLDEYQASAQDKFNQVQAKVNPSVDINAKIEAFQKDLGKRFQAKSAA